VIKRRVGWGAGVGVGEAVAVGAGVGDEVTTGDGDETSVGDGDGATLGDGDDSAVGDGSADRTPSLGRSAAVGPEGAHAAAVRTRHSPRTERARPNPTTTQRA